MATVGREEFFPVGAATMGFGSYARLQLAAAGNGFFTFRVPRDFIELLSLEAICIPGSGTGGSGKDIDLTSEYGAAGEAFDNHTEADVTTTQTFIVETINEFSVSQVFSQLAAGDFCGLNINHTAVGGNVHYLGIRLRYLGDDTPIR